MSPDERFAAWVEWARRLVKEIGDAHVERAIWREMTDQLDTRLPDSVGFRNHYARLYADAQAMAVRRLVDKGRDTQSLTRLLVEIQLHRDVLTRNRYVGMHTPEEEERTARLFDDLFGLGSDRVSDHVLDEDIATLDAVAGPVARWATSMVAHMLDRPAHTTYGEIHTALETISEVLRRYYILLTATDIDLVPSIAGDWRRPFRAPLFDPVP